MNPTLRTEHTSSASTARRRHPFRTVRQRLVKTLLAMAIVFGGGLVGGEAALWGTASGQKLRMLAAETVITTRHRWYAHFLTTPAEYQQLMSTLNQATQNTGVSSEIAVAHGQIGSADARAMASAKQNIQVIPISGSSYNGYVVLIHNPRTVRLVHAKIVGDRGEYITDMAPRVGGVLGINASGFLDPKGGGWGGRVMGLELDNGQILHPALTSPGWTSVGFTRNGVMVMGSYTGVQMQRLGVRDAMQFRPELVFQGKPMITYGDGGWGYGPRTAVGQAKDGTVIFVVTNGRFHGGAGMGASQRQVMDLMLKYHAWNACAMDGGSSSVLYSDGKIINSPSTIDPTGERTLPDAWMVFPSEQAAQSYAP